MLKLMCTVVAKSKLIFTDSSNGSTTVLSDHIYVSAKIDCVEYQELMNSSTNVSCALLNIISR